MRSIHSGLDRKASHLKTHTFPLIALLVSGVACKTQARTRSGFNPPQCDARDESASLRMVDGRCTLIDAPGYRIGRRPQAMPAWHDYSTGEARAQSPSHPILCGQGCVEIELVFADWTNTDDPVVRLAVNPETIWTDTHFPLTCLQTAEGKVCRISLMNGVTTIIEVPRYTLMPGGPDGRGVSVRGRILARYQGQPICSSRIGIGLYAIQAPLVATNGEIMGHGYGYCEVYSRP